MNAEISGGGQRRLQNWNALLFLKSYDISQGRGENSTGAATIPVGCGGSGETDVRVCILKRFDGCKSAAQKREARGNSVEL
jgi:hypothetical protein